MAVMSSILKKDANIYIEIRNLPYCKTSICLVIFLTYSAKYYMSYARIF